MSAYIGHATGKVKYDVDGTFLYPFDLLPLILCESVVPDCRDTVGLFYTVSPKKTSPTFLTVT